MSVSIYTLMFVCTCSRQSHLVSLANLLAQPVNVLTAILSQIVKEAPRSFYLVKVRVLLLSLLAGMQTPQCTGNNLAGAKAFPWGLRGGAAVCGGAFSNVSGAARRFRRSLLGP